MRRSAALALFLLLLATDAALAGAWLREKGKGFLSTSVEIDKTAQGATSIYLEYGLREKTTLGADINLSFDSLNGMRAGYAGLFLRRPLGRTDRNARMAWHVGLGANFGTETTPFVETGLSWGRGMSLWERQGWMALDARLKWDTGTKDTTIKLDGTIGLGLGEKTKAMMQVFLEQTDDGLSSTFAPSLLYTPKSGKFTLQVGAELPFSGDQNPTIKFGIWRDF